MKNGQSPVRCSDINNAYLPRFDVERHFINIAEDRETVLVMQTKENQDNAYVLTQIAAQAAAQVAARD